MKTIDVSEMYATEFWRCPNEGAYCSPYTLLRLFADKVPEIPDKILYLDADIMFNRDFTLLYDIDVSDVEYAAARDHYGKFILYYNYINAGVLLLNMKMIRETGALEKARELIKSKKLPFADQSAIIRSTGKKKCCRNASTIRSFCTNGRWCAISAKDFFTSPIRIRTISSNGMWIKCIPFLNTISSTIFWKSISR